MMVGSLKNIKQYKKMSSIEKVIAYITHGNKLLVFSHPRHPEAGIQVPAGTIEEGESPLKAVLREAWEETGLENLKVISYLGTREMDTSKFGLQGIQRWHYYHLSFNGKTTDTWQHFEMNPSDGSPGPIEFEFYWVKYPAEVPELIAGQEALLSCIRLPEEGL